MKKKILGMPAWLFILVAILQVIITTILVFNWWLSLIFDFLVWCFVYHYRNHHKLNKIYKKLNNGEQLNKKEIVAIMTSTHDKEAVLYLMENYHDDLIEIIRDMGSLTTTHFFKKYDA